MDDLSIVLPEFRHWDSRVAMFGQSSPVIRDCEWRIKTFVQRDAYPWYDVVGQRLPASHITQQHLSAMNAAMRARSSSKAWGPFLDAALPELEAIPADLDLIDGSEEQVTEALRELSDLVRRIASVPGLTDMAVSKVLHLLRPRFIAVSDSYVRELLLLPDELYPMEKPEWCVRRLGDVESSVREVGLRNVDALETLHAYTATLVDKDGAWVVLSKVRILDILLWTYTAVQRHGRWHKWYQDEILGSGGSQP